MTIVSVQSAIGKHVPGISVLIRIYGFKDHIYIISATIKKVLHFARFSIHGKNENGM